MNVDDYKRGRTSPRPRQFSSDHASRFKNRSLAEAYKFRPPYSDELYETLIELLGDENGRILDVGCGQGKVARTLVEHVERVDAVDFSQEMIRVGKSIVNGNHPNLRWIHGRVEECTVVSAVRYDYGRIEYPLDGVERGFSEVQGSADSRWISRLSLMEIVL